MSDQGWRRAKMPVHPKTACGDDVIFVIDRSPQMDTESMDSFYGFDAGKAADTTAFPHTSFPTTDEIDAHVREAQRLRAETVAFSRHDARTAITCLGDLRSSPPQGETPMLLIIGKNVAAVRDGAARSLPSSITSHTFECDAQTETDGMRKRAGTILWEEPRWPSPSI